jgi:hypothetical protein
MTIENTDYHGLREHLTREHGETLTAEHDDSMAEWRYWTPDISNWSEQLGEIDGQHDLADIWDLMDAGEQAAMLREAVDQYQEELIGSYEAKDLTPWSDAD